MISVLRLVGRSTLISGRVFDDAFCRDLAPDVVVEPVDLSPWLDSILDSGRLQADARVSSAFRRATSGFDFLCPNHVAISLVPLLLELRNRSISPIRLLLIAHAPGAYALEWALLRPLLQPGDVIVAPTHSAAEVIHFLCPDLAAYVHVIPHPIRPLPPCGDVTRPFIVSLTRLHPEKLLHRQIEALALLRSRGFRDLRMQIACPIHSPGTRDLLPYARTLAAKVRRLGLEDRIELVGEVGDEAQKSQFLAQARLVVNLSVTVEESFGKAIAEALGSGVPVLSTRWNGLPETAGDGGACVPVEATPFGMDVSAERVAEGIAALLEAPPGPQACEREALRFHPQRVRSLYRRVLEVARDARLPGGPSRDDAGESSAAPPEGLLGVTAPLTRYSWGELFELHLHDVARRRQSLAGEILRDRCDADQLRTLLLFGTQAPLGRLLAGLPLEGKEQPVGRARLTAGGEGPLLPDKIAAAALSRATPGSRLTCLSLLAETGQLATLRSGIESLRADGLRSWAIDYLEIEALRLEGQYQQAFRMSMEGDDPLSWGELAAERVRQLAAVCRTWGLPGLALPWLRTWLERFPDGPNSAMGAPRPRC